MITNLTKKIHIARKPVYPSDFISRSRGMIFRDFTDFDAMVFNNCSGIHTMLMQIKIDVLFIDIENRVCDFRKKLVPWKPMVRSAQAVAVIELPSGTIEETNTEIGDIIDLNAELSSEQKEQKEQLLPTPEVAVPMKPETNR